MKIKYTEKKNEDKSLQKKGEREGEEGRSKRRRMKMLKARLRKQMREGEMECRFIKKKGGRRRKGKDEMQEDNGQG